MIPFPVFRSPLRLLPSSYPTSLPPLDHRAVSLALLYDPVVPLVRALPTVQAWPSSSSSRPPSQLAQPRPKNRSWSETKTTHGARSWVSPQGYQSSFLLFPFSFHGLTADAGDNRARGFDARGRRDEGRAIEGGGQVGEAEDRGMRVWAGCHTRSGERTDEGMLPAPHPMVPSCALLQCINQKQSPF